MKKPKYEDGKMTAVLTNDPMMNDDNLDRLLNTSEYRDLTWNNYFEDIGDGKKYKG